MPLSQYRDQSIGYRCHAGPEKNRLKLLCETMDPVQAQTFARWEHLIIDDGSNDGTAEEVARRAVVDARIRYIERTGDEVGANVCRNIGMPGVPRRSDRVCRFRRSVCFRTACVSASRLWTKTAIWTLRCFRAGSSPPPSKRKGNGLFRLSWEATWTTFFIWNIHGRLRPEFGGASRCKKSGFCRNDL